MKIEMQNIGRPAREEERRAMSNDCVKIVNGPKSTPPEYCPELQMGLTFFA